MCPLKLHYWVLWMSEKRQMWMTKRMWAKNVKKGKGKGRKIEGESEKSLANNSVMGNVPTILQIRSGRTFWGVKAAGSSAMFWVVVDEHVVRHGQHVTIHINRCRYNDLWRKRKDCLKACSISTLGLVWRSS